MNRIASIFIATGVLLTSCLSKNTELDQLINDKGLYAIVILKDNKTVFRKFYNGKTEDDLFNIQSETKSIISILTGIAIGKGIIQDPDQPVIDLLPARWHSKDTGKRQITIRHLLNQTSGLQDFEFPNMDQWLNDTNPSRLILSQPLVSFPGKIYQYNTAGTHLLSVIISEASNMETA